MTTEQLLKKIDWEKANGLVPVVAQQASTSRVLMLGFMNQDALQKTLKDGKITYWSRSRQKLWTKGEASGHFQILKEIFLDCDNDTLLIKVKQIGNVCHTGHKTCFFRRIS